MSTPLWQCTPRVCGRLSGPVPRYRQGIWTAILLSTCADPAPEQVSENRESTEMQYRLRERAEALGWPPARVLVIDDDLGQSGQSIAGRPGFQRLLAEVGLDHVASCLGWR